MYEFYWFNLHVLISIVCVRCVCGRLMSINKYVKLEVFQFVIRLGNCLFVWGRNHMHALNNARWLQWCAIAATAAAAASLNREDANACTIHISSKFCRMEMCTHGLCTHTWCVRCGYAYGVRRTDHTDHEQTKQMQSAVAIESISIYYLYICNNPPGALDIFTFLPNDTNMRCEMCLCILYLRSAHSIASSVNTRREAELVRVRDCR